MPMYALATLPLSDRLPNTVHVTQVWYADDVCACGSIVKLCDWWDHLHQVGPGFGYNVNASNTWLVTKPSFHSFAVSQFSGCNVNIICDGWPYLGAAIGTQEFCKKFLEHKVKVWSAEVFLLAKIAESQLHAAFSAFTHGLSSRWCFVFRTVPDIDKFLQPLEDVIRCTLLPVLLGISPPNDTLRNLIALPPHWGGLGILNPTALSDQEYSASLTITNTEPLSHHIGSGQCVDYFQVKSEQLSRKSKIRLSKHSMYSNTSAGLHVELDHAS